MERVNREHGGAYIVVALDPWEQGAVCAVVPTSEEQSEAQTSVLNLKSPSCVWRDGLRPVSCGGGSF